MPSWLNDFPELTALAVPVDLAAPVVYFPVRHHSPACAWHVRRLIRERRPAAVLIEGPRDATPLIPLLLHPATRLPVAIFTTWAQPLGRDLPLRHSAYYPLCETSPEAVALRAAAEAGAQARFIDLTFPEMIEAGAAAGPEGKAANLFEEQFFRHSRLLARLCERTGARDPDDLWDHLYETDYEARPTQEFIRNVLAYCALARAGQTETMLEADGTLARERAMAAAIAEAREHAGGQVIVVTGGFHSVALPRTEPASTKKSAAEAGEALVALVRYSFEQLDRLNGYASGMPSPEFYQRAWEGREPAELLVELGREARRQRADVSVADELAALAHARGLAGLRGHPRLAREDLLDAIRSTFIKGSAEIEGVLILALARKLLAGERIGELPPDAGQLPLVADFRQSAKRLGLDLARIETREATLDIYRRKKDRELSRLFYRLRFLGVHFADCVRGPNFVQGSDLERVQEVWRYGWSPRCEAELIERSAYGSTVEEAVAALLLERFAAAEAEAQGRRAELAARLLLEGCRMGLHRLAPDLLRRTTALAAADEAFGSLVGALEAILMLSLSREPLEAQHLVGLPELAEGLYQRACYLIPELGATPEEEIDEAMDSLCALRQGVETLGDTPERREMRNGKLRELAAAAGCEPTIRGAACGLLYGDGWAAAEELARGLAGQFQSPGAAGAGFLRGVLRTARSVLWQAPGVIAEIHAVLREWDEETFIRQLPLLRLALADLTPAECDRVARAVGEHAGVGDFQIATAGEGFSEAEVIAALEINRRVAGLLEQDQLGEFIMNE